MGRRAAVLAIALLAAATACSGDDSASVSSVPSVSTSTGAQPDTTAVGDPVDQTRAAILAAATAKDYDALEPLVDSRIFLSDAGLGQDPIAFWRDQGTAPLDAMAAVLALPSTTLETNEGTVHQWPRFTSDSDPADMSASEREALTALLGEGGLARAFNAETGYVAPRLGILDDGTWFFFIQSPAP